MVRQPHLRTLFTTHVYLLMKKKMSSQFLGNYRKRNCAPQCRIPSSLWKRRLRRQRGVRVGVAGRRAGGKARVQKRIETFEKWCREVNIALHPHVSPSSSSAVVITCRSQIVSRLDRARVWSDTMECFSGSIYHHISCYSFCV